MIKPDILIIAPDDDAHALVVAKQIKKIDSSISIFFLDSGYFPQQMYVQTLFKQNKQMKSLLFKDEEISLDFVRSVWHRRVRNPIISPAIVEKDQIEFATRETQHCITGLFHSMRSFWVNPPMNDRFATYKVNQLKVAQEVGLNIPDTLITNNPEQVREFYNSYPQIIYKQLRGIDSKFVQTSILDESNLKMIDAVQLAPVIFQEMVPASYDLRVTVIGNEIFPVRILSQESQSTLDWRCDHGTNMEKCAIPTELQHKIKSLMNNMGLIYGALDFRVTPENKYVFFEVNPSGQFLFNEVNAEWSLSEKFAQLLIRGSA